MEDVFSRYQPTIEKYLCEANVSLEDQKMWTDKLKKQPESILLLFVKIFTTDRRLLLDMTHNLKLKISALKEPSHLQDVWENVYA